MVQQEQRQRQRELQIRQDYLDNVMGAAIKDAQTTQMKLAAKVAGEMKRIGWRGTVLRKR
jgi:hypothetical protein